ncbi:uncharacterized protein LOC124079305 isoform X2 [Marmota monax]|uniref:uncharacterized protein LOC124079305 isoform X2 n=1 Tax=Marmota monax TaxID=9995 RepID=UPI0026EA1640|nr:uncharacterized protein LOC124079305 isoform X2 [Marmota monax]
MVTKPGGVLSAQQPCPHSPWRDSSTAARGGRPGISCPGGATPCPLLEQPRRPRQGSASSPRPGPGGLEERGAALGRSCWLRSAPSQGGPAAPRTSSLRPAQEGLLQFRERLDSRWQVKDIQTLEDNIQTWGTRTRAKSWTGQTGPGGTQGPEALPPHLR